MPEPLLNDPHRYAIGKLERRTTVTQIVETDLPHIELLENHREVLRHIVRADQLSDGIDTDVFIILMVVSTPHDFLHLSLSFFLMLQFFYY